MAGWIRGEWVRAAESHRCKVTMEVLGLPHSRCDLLEGHQGLHQYMSVAGSVVSFSFEIQRLSISTPK